MFINKEATLLDLTISNNEIKMVQTEYESGNFRDAKKYLNNIDKLKLSDNEKKEYDKLTSLLSLDIWGIIAGVTLLIIVIYFVIDYSNI